MSFFKTYWVKILSVWIAFVFVQSLFFKFSGSPETQYIFGTLAEWSGLAWFGTYGAYMIGIAELFASVVLFTRFYPWAALLAFEILAAAIVFHLFTPLGVVMPAFGESGAVIGDDGGTLFIMACFTCLCAAAIVISDWVSANSQFRKVFSAKRVEASN